MKKKWKAVLIMAAAVLCVVFAWRAGYELRKNTDNLPSLQAVSEMSEAEVNDLLPGYKIAQLESVWGKPERNEDSAAYWKAGELTLIVNHKGNGVVAVCGLKDAADKSVVHD